MTDWSADSPASGGAALALLDKVLTVQAPLVQRHIARLRHARPEASPRAIVGRLNAELRATTIAAGAAVGAAAAAPGVGTAAALALSGGEAVGFLNAATLYVLARSEVHGLEVRDLERRRALVMAVMLGELGANGVLKVAERTGRHWARHLVQKVPVERIVAINRVLGRNFVTKYGTKEGIVVLGRIVPFGIGAVIGGAANAAFSQGIITSSNRAFGPAPTWWEQA